MPAPASTNNPPLAAALATSGRILALFASERAFTPRGGGEWRETRPREPVGRTLSGRRCRADAVRQSLWGTACPADAVGQRLSGHARRERYDAVSGLGVPDGEALLAAL